MKHPTVIRRIVLTGFMGAGKSTVGALLAQKLGWNFLDVDAAIEAQTGKKIAKIFADGGEAVFRSLEAEAIREHAVREHRVLALGGGAVEAESTRELLIGLDQTCVVFLDAPLEVLIARCVAQPGAAERPVLAKREALLRRFETRLPYYREAHVTIATSGLSAGQVAEQVLEAIRRGGEIDRLEKEFRPHER